MAHHPAYRYYFRKRLEDIVDVERLLFETARQDAIARLFGFHDGGEFTTEQYADSYARVCSAAANRRGSSRFPAIALDVARGHLADCESVIMVGVDSWMTTDSRPK